MFPFGDQRAWKKLEEYSRPYMKHIRHRAVVATFKTILIMIVAEKAAVAGAVSGRTVGKATGTTDTLTRRCM